MAPQVDFSISCPSPYSFPYPPLLFPSMLILHLQTLPVSKKFSSPGSVREILLKILLKQPLHKNQMLHSPGWEDTWGCMTHILSASIPLVST